MRWLRILAFPFSLLYALIVHLRNYLYDVGFFYSKKFITPTVCIGNLNTGGAGKTPMISFFVDLLEKEYRLAMLSRGYRRKSKGFILAKTGMTAETLGDEPFQLFNKHHKLTVAVDANRCRGITILEEKIKPDLILLDDAFQHRKVHPHISFLLTAYDNLYVDDWYLPTGNLRDAKNQAKRAEVIVVTKCPELPSKTERESIIKKLNPHPLQQVVFGTLVYGRHLIGVQKKFLLRDLKGRKLALVTGIADPKPLVSYLQGLHFDFDFFEHSDHHYFSNAEFEKYSEYDIVLTTEKDFVRMGGRLPNAYFLEMSHYFTDDDIQKLKNAITKNIKLRSLL